MLERRTDKPRTRDDPTRRAPAAGRAALSISIIGAFSASCGGQELKLKTRKAGAVLAYLALSETKQESRERLVGFLWSRSEETKARTSLRQILHDIRRAFSKAGFAGLRTGKLTVALDPENVVVDLVEVMRQADGFRAHPRLLHTPHLTERLFEGLDDLDPSFRVWVLAKRQTIQDRLLRGLNAGLASPAATPKVKRELAAAILNIDPTHEEACRYAMHAHAATGDLAGALRLYKTLWELLDREYGMEPSAETLDLVARIKLGEFECPSERDAALAKIAAGALSTSRGEGGAPPLAPQAGAPPKILLLLAPFEMKGVGPDKAHLVSGFRHHLAACLVRFREWSVIDNGAIPESLNGGSPTTARYSLDATAYQAGAVVNMVLTLRENAQGRYIWSESFELTLEGWFEAQQRIIRRLTSSLNVQLSTERLMRMSAEPDVSLDIYDRWLRGQALLARFDPQSWKRASSLFAEAVRDSPDFSPIHSSIAQMDNIEHFVHPGLHREASKARETVARAKTAVRLDPVDSRAHLCLGWSHSLAQEYDAAAPHMELARELNPNDPWTLVSAAAYWAFCGERDKAIALAREAMLLSIAPAPYHWGYQAIILFLSGDYHGVLEAADRAEDVIKTLPAWRAAALFHLGWHEAAAREGRRFLDSIRSCWFGRERPSDLAIARWLLHAHPIRWRAQWECLRDGIQGAAIPTEGVEHPVW
jgi:DNA-binding SARP family transcriptional activator/TolB-like protein